LFCCYTGLIYGDIRELKKKHIQIFRDGKKCIFNRSIKTTTVIRIPLMFEIERIIEKDHDHQKVFTNYILPVYYNKKTNQYLRKITKDRKIDK
jgi:hypothetical protein